MNLLDRLKAWHSSGPGSTELREMARIGLRIITGYIQQQHPQVRACAYTHSPPPTHPGGQTLMIHEVSHIMAGME